MRLILLPADILELHRANVGDLTGNRVKNEGALNLTDYVLPDVPLRQFATGAAKPRGAGVGRAGPSDHAFPTTLSARLRRKLLGQVVRIFTDTVATW